MLWGSTHSKILFCINFYNTQRPKENSTGCYKDTFQERERGKEERRRKNWSLYIKQTTLTPSSPRKLGLNQTGCLVTVSLLLTHPASYWYVIHLTLHKVDAHFFSFFFFSFGHMACGVSVPRPGIELRIWQWKSGILTTRAPGSSLMFISIWFHLDTLA